VRIAAAAAQAVAFARGLPVCRISSLAVLALGAGRAMGAERIAACLDAHMGRAYLGLYRVVPAQGDVQVLCADSLVDPGRFMLNCSDRFVAVGNGWHAYPELLARHGSRIAAVDAGRLPSVLDLLDLASVDFHAGRTATAFDALPEYLGSGPATASVSPPE
jgi:tRNA threonylcarbamoyladenosine biosynthesis protein TsaB